MPQSPNKPSGPAGRNLRRWSFRFAAIALALAPFATIEIYLRCTTHVDSGDLSYDPIFDTTGQSDLFVLSEDATRWQIPESRMNFFRPASFAAVKPAALRRVFVLGGSTVQGRPYETETAFAKWAELRLAAADSSSRFELVNCGGVSYASYRVAILVDEVLRHAPDAIVLYTGHNEFLEERSYNTMADRRSILQRLAKRSRLVQLIGRSLRPPTAAPSDGQSEAPARLTDELQTRLDLQNGMDRYVRDADWRSGVVEHFRISLRRIIATCRDAKVPLILCVPTSDLVRTPPLKVMAREMDDEDQMRFQREWERAIDGESDVDRRLQACHTCLEIDPHHAGAHYIAGRIYWDRQRIDLAREHLSAARDDDVCPLRATTPIIDSILEIATKEGVPLVRCDQLFDQYDPLKRRIPDGIPDPSRFVDHIHPSIAGHQEIGAVVAASLLQVFEIEPADDAAAEYDRLASEHLQSLDETYFARAKQRLEGLQRWASGRAGELSLPVDGGSR